MVFALFLRMLNAVKFILNMKRLPFILMMIMAGLFLAFQTMGTGTKTPPGKYEEILKLVGQMLSQAHYSPQDINDDFSKKIFKKYIGDLDPEKNMFLQSDMNSLKKRYEDNIDNEIKGSPAEFFLAAGKLFNTRMECLKLNKLSYFPSIFPRFF